MPVGDLCAVSWRVWPVGGDRGRAPRALPRTTTGPAMGTAAREPGTDVVRRAHLGLGSGSR